MAPCSASGAGWFISRCSGDRVSDRYGDSSQDVSLVAAMPGLIRLSAQMSWKMTEWGIATSVRAYSRLLRAAANGESLSQLMADAGSEMREYIRSLLEIVDPEDERWMDDSDGY